MGEKRAKGFVLERDQKEIIDELSNEEAGIIFKAIYEYEETKEEPKLDKILKIVFKQFKVKLDSYDNAYEEKCLKNKENIEKRWKKNNDTNVYDGIRTYTNIIKMKEIKENKNKKNKNECENKFSHNNSAVGTLSPSLENIISYSHELGLDDNDYCEEFYNHYEAIGWVNGSGVEIKNWKLVFNNWVKKDKKKNGGESIEDRAKRIFGDT